MKISNFSILPAMFAPGDEVSLSFTVKAESEDTLGSDGLMLWLRIPGYGETSAWQDPSFSISKGKSKTVAVKTVLSFGSYTVARGSTFSTFGVQLGYFGSRVNVEFPITLLDAHYKPSISVFAAERSTGSEPDDEGENLLASIGLGVSAAAKIENMSLHLYYQDMARPDADPLCVDLTHLMTAALAGELETVISETLNKNADWSLVLRFGDAYESAAHTIQLSRAFANVHLSGASTGGVCFGSFSKATENNPLFQCYYPAEFYGGIHGVTNYARGEVETGGRWIDGKKIYRYVLAASASADGSEETIGALPSGIETIISSRGTMRSDDGSFRPIPYVYYGSLNWSANYYIKADRTVSVQIGSSYSGTHTVIIIFEYTKSTEEVS